eukprot:jgi/Bigna1/76315/fgenesh1_pg.40_\
MEPFHPLQKHRRVSCLIYIVVAAVLLSMLRRFPSYTPRENLERSISTRAMSPGGQMMARKWGGQRAQPTLPSLVRLPPLSPLKRFGAQSPHYPLTDTGIRQTGRTASGGDDKEAKMVGNFEEVLCQPIRPSVIEKLTQRGIVTPTPIQAASFKRIYEGESAILHAETGSGKSLAFILPTLLRMDADKAARVEAEQENLSPADSASSMLMLAPTRELAVQLASEVSALVDDPSSVQLVVAGATPLFKALKNARIIVGTPGEIDEWRGRRDGAVVEMRDLSFLSHLKHIVLDEVDEKGDKKDGTEETRLDRRTIKPTENRMNISQILALVDSVKPAQKLRPVDYLLPTVKFYGPRAKAKKVKFNRWSEKKLGAAEKLLSQVVLPNALRPDIQVVCASATVGRECISKVYPYIWSNQVKMKVNRVLRKVVWIDRWKDDAKGCKEGVRAEMQNHGEIVDDVP